MPTPVSSPRRLTGIVRPLPWATLLAEKPKPGSGSSRPLVSSRQQMTVGLGIDKGRHNLGGQRSQCWALNWPLKLRRDFSDGRNRRSLFSGPHASRQTLGWQRYLAAQTLDCESKINRAAKLVGYEIADHAGAIAGLACSDRRAADLDPFQRQLCFLFVQIPAHRNATVRRRKRTVFDGIRDQLVQDDRHWLGCLRGEQHVGAFHTCAVCLHKRCQLNAYQLGEPYPMPMAAAQ